MRKSLGVCLLVLLLTGSAVAGEMPNWSPVAQSAQPTNAAQEPTAEGNIPDDATESLTQIALALLALLPSLP